MEFELRDRAIYLPDFDTLVCADLHVGKDATSNVELRLGEREDLTDRFDVLLECYEPAEVIFAGDLLHSFENLPTGVIGTIRALSETARKAGVRLRVTPGNHDPMLDELWDESAKPELRLGDELVVAHGHVEPAAAAERYVVGHDHPTIEVEGVRRPCYLYGSGQYRGADVLMLPSFSRLPAGVAVNRMSAADFQSPLITNADALRPIVRDEDADETHEFPPLGEFRRLL